MKVHEKSIINLDQIEFSRHTNGENFDAETAPVANRIGANKLGYRVTKLPPGKRAWPLHAHYVNEEMFFVLSGTGSVRLGEETHSIRAGDFIAAPPNPECAHQIVNTSDSELVYICVSTMLEPEVAVYPESGKMAVVAGDAPGRTKDNTLFKVFKQDAGVDYWDDEK